MKLKITHMKAPWPPGAGIGDVLELPSIPGWALGKCEQVGDKTPLTIVQGDGSCEKLPEADNEQKTDGKESVPVESDAGKEKPSRGRPPKVE